jgi:KipI family sensor histidine kinase inhibitor
MKFKIAGVDALLIEFGEEINIKTHKLVMANYHRLNSFLEVTPSYTSILVRYGADRSYEETVERIKELLITDVEEIYTDSKEIVIPVYYDESVGIDLKRVAEYNSIGVKDVIKRHTSRIYDVYAVGFLPGFAYLGVVDIPTPRKAPVSVKKGSVAIADFQTGIYPLDSPGGWNVIGRTFVEMFDQNIEGFSLLKVGDRVKFEAVSRSEFINKGGVIEDN